MSGLECSHKYRFEGKYMRLLICGLNQGFVLQTCSLHNVTLHIIYSYMFLSIHKNLS